MASLKIYNRTGNEVGTYEVNPADFAPRINKQLLHDAVVLYQRNLRMGTHKTKTRSEVEGSTRKLYRQKGTGRARAGSIRSGVRRGGGHIFAKVPRDWTIRMPRQALQTATRMALASKIRDNEVVLIDELSFDEPQTKAMAVVLRALQCHEGSLLIATASHDPNVYKSARNIAGVSVAAAGDLNALAILGPKRLLLTRAAMDALVARFPARAAKAAV
jgi:large subunit ribosomal protein L4